MKPTSYFHVARLEKVGANQFAPDMVFFLFVDMMSKVLLRNGSIFYHGIAVHVPELEPAETLS